MIAAFIVLSGLIFTGASILLVAMLTYWWSEREIRDENN